MYINVHFLAILKKADPATTRFEDPTRPKRLSGSCACVHAKQLYLGIEPLELGSPYRFVLWISRKYVCIQLTMYIYNYISTILV